MKSKKALEMNFTMMFAIIAGAMILVLAIYGATKFSETSRLRTEAETVKKLDNLLDPMQAGFASGTADKITFRQDARINNYCLDDEFGRNILTVQLRASIKEPFLNQTIPVSLYNKYIFSSSDEGRTFYVFSKPFSMPYKIADLIFMTSKRYCFIEPTDNIREEIEGLRLGNINITNETGQKCPANSTRVCFGGYEPNCDILVFGTCPGACDSPFDEGFVENKGRRMPYVGSLMYGAIFASPDNYDCNVKRLMYRASSIAKVFADKTDLMNARGCNTNIKSDLALYYEMTGKATVDDLIVLNMLSKDINDKNKGELCSVW